MFRRVQTNAVISRSLALSKTKKSSAYSVTATSSQPHISFFDKGKAWWKKCCKVSDLKVTATFSISQTVLPFFLRSQQHTTTCAPLIDIYKTAEHKGSRSRTGWTANLHWFDCGLIKTAPFVQKPYYLEASCLYDYAERVLWFFFGVMLSHLLSWQTCEGEAACSLTFSD